MSLRAAAFVLWWRGNPLVDEGDCFGPKSTALAMTYRALGGPVSVLLFYLQKEEQ